MSGHAASTSETLQRAIRPAALILCALAIVYVDRAFLQSKLPVLLLPSDNLDIIYPLFHYFFEGLRDGRIEFYQPFSWAGKRLIGDPNFELNLIQLLAGELWGTTAAFSATTYLYFVERIAAFFGMYLLLRRIVFGLNEFIAMLLAVAYVYSNGYSALSQLTSTSVHFATAPWLLYFLASAHRLRQWGAWIGLTGLLFIQFSYGQLQFSVYVTWFSLAFIAFYLPWPDKKGAFFLFIATGATAALLSAFFLLPLIDSLFFAEDRVSGRAAQGFKVDHQLVPIFYLIRLLVPKAFGGEVDWWPLWHDGWSRLESFSAFQGVAMTLLAVFGLGLRQVPLYFRSLYVFLIVTVAFRPALVIPYILNLGASVPYGRQTIFIAIIAPIMSAHALMAVIKHRQVAVAFATWCATWAAACLAIYIYGFPRQVIEEIYAYARRLVVSEVLSYPEAQLQTATDFLQRFDQPLRVAFAEPALFAGAVGGVVLAMILIQSVVIQSWRHTATSLCAIAICGMTLAQSIVLHRDRGISQRNPVHERNDRPTIDLVHPLERALVAAGAQVTSGPILYRLHVDIYFKEHRDGTEPGRILVNAEGPDNRFRTLPNFLASNHIPVTTGYSSLIPQAKQLIDLLKWTPNHPPMTRALGSRISMHPALLHALGVKWVLRHQPDVTKLLQGAPDDLDDAWEKIFQASSKLIYSDKYYRLYEYKDARPAVDIPDKVAFGQDAVSTLRALEDPVSTSLATAAIATERDSLTPDIKARVERERGAFVARQVGRIVEMNGDAGRFTKLTVEMDTPGFVLLGVKFDKWWNVYINGTHVPLVRANGVFAAVQVPAGHSEIELRLRPWSAWIGLAISALTLLAVVGSLLLFLLQPRWFRQSLLERIKVVKAVW